MHAVEFCEMRGCGASATLAKPVKESEMKITYDRGVDALYIRFNETTVTTEQLAEGIAADYDSLGRLAGIQIRDAIKQLGDPETFRQVTLEWWPSPAPRRPK
jgi:uncharacterized protein YuzE